MPQEISIEIGGTPKGFETYFMQCPIVDFLVVLFTRINCASVPSNKRVHNQLVPIKNFQPTSHKLK
jgi:hypothetical protein